MKYSISLICALLWASLSLIATDICYLNLTQYEKPEIIPSVYTDIHITTENSHNRHIPPPNLLSYSSSQLKAYFAYHRFTEKDILSQNILYTSDEKEEPLVCLIDGEIVYSVPQKINLPTILLSSTKQGGATWISKGGLIYGPDKKFGSRVFHVLQHTIPDNTKLNHTVFTVAGDDLFNLIDFAWSKKSIPLPNDPGAYIVDLGKTIGTLGETAIKIVTIPETNNILTAYPIKI